MTTKQEQQERRSRYGKELLYNPILQVVRDLGGSATTPEIESGVIDRMSEGDKMLEETNTSGRSYFLIGLNWARHELMKSGYLENVAETSARGVWALTAEGIATEIVDSEEVKRRYRAVDRQKRREREQSQTRRTSDVDELDDEQTDALQDDDSKWRDRLMSILQSMKPGDFERLCQLILRKSGFTEVVVTGRSGDGGIDGKGIVRIGELISFPILFQCKRWENSVGSKEVRDFRGAMQGRADRGLLMTTSTFSPAASKEASRDGAPTIDLIDGDALIDRLKDLELGVEVEMVEQVTVDTDWWESNYGVSPG